MITKTYSDGQLICGDCLAWLKTQPDDSVDLIFGSPPYEDARQYGIDFRLKGQDWVDWMLSLWAEFDRVSKGLVAMVVEGRTRDRVWTATPALLMADLARAGYGVRKPPIYQRFGICGSGGPEWLRNDYEFIVCTSKGKIPGADNTAMGLPPKYEKVGGKMSNRHEDGARANLGKKTPVAVEIANPGNIIDCGAVGGGNIGCGIAHEGEAPFPEKLATFFVRSFCPKGGIVLDPFSGSGTTVSVARQHRRRFIGIDIRESQIELSDKRLQNGALRQGFDLE